MLQILCLKCSKTSFLKVRFYLVSTNKAVIISEMNFVARQIYKYTNIQTSLAAAKSGMSWNGEMYLPSPFSEKHNKKVALQI